MSLIEAYLDIESDDKSTGASVNGTPVLDQHEDDTASAGQQKRNGTRM